MPSLLEAHLRHAKYFGNTVLKATELFQNGDKDQLTALTEIDKELPNIEIGWDWITNHASNVEVDTLLLDYGVKGVILIGSRYSARTLIQRQQLTIIAARNLGRAYDEATSLANIGNAYINLGEAQKALKFYQQSMDILQKVEKTDENEHKDRIGVGNVLCSIGNAYFLLGEITEAQKWFNQSLVVTQAGNQSVGIDALIGLGIIYRLKGEILKSLSYYEQALQIIQKIGDKPAEARILSELGNVNRSVGNLDQALEFHNQALLIAHSIGYKGLEGAILGNIGTDYYMQADGHRAIEYHKLHLAITRELGNRGGEGSALGNLGLADLILGNVQSAVDYFMQHLTIAQEINDRRGEMNALRNLGMSYRALGKTSKAISYMEESLLITKELDSQSAEIDLVEKLDLLYAQSSTELNFYNFYEDYKFLFSLKISPGWHRNPLDTKFIAQGGRIALTHPLGGTVNISCGHLYSRISINKDKRTKEILDFLRNLPGRTSFPIVQGFFCKFGQVILAIS